MNITSYMANSLEFFCANKGIAQINEQPHGTQAAGDIDERECEHGVEPLNEYAEIADAKRLISGVSSSGTDYGGRC